MARPEDIPEWAWEKAVEITIGTMAFGSPLFTARLARTILAAVEEEREACAAVADDDDGDHTVFGEDRNTRVAQMTARAIAAAIRNRPVTNKE